jgi:murein DD-endopeptidase MepM/ murein hydrolase activator NlpD
MNVLFLSQSAHNVHSYQISFLKLLSVTIIFTIVVIAATFSLTYWNLQTYNSDKHLKNWQKTLISQKQDMKFIKSQAQSKFNAVVDRISKIQMQINNIDSIAKRIIEENNLNKNEFNFTSQPGTGGPIDPLSQDDNNNTFLDDFDYLSYIDDLSKNINNKEIQMQVIENIILQKVRTDRIMPAGMPVKRGYISSRFGYRKDPFTKKIKMHKGVDIATKYGSDVLSVADGIVTVVESKKGYGMLVEVKHGNGIRTRYAHNSRSLVKVGSQVKAGQAIAKIGQTGRSTGPHLHFEVVKNGEKINPMPYINKKRSLSK